MREALAPGINVINSLFLKFSDDVPFQIVLAFITFSYLLRYSIHLLGILVSSSIQLSGHRGFLIHISLFTWYLFIPTQHTFYVRSSPLLLSSFL